MSISNHVPARAATLLLACATLAASSTQARAQAASTMPAIARTVNRAHTVVQEMSFVGVAFGVQDDSTYEAVYLRPFNFRTPDTARAKRAVQYVSQPTYPWQKLRQESPGKYEQPVRPVPDPTGWVPLRLVVTRTQVSVYANAGD